MSGGAMTAVPANHPLMIAWTAYKETEAFENARNWAMKDRAELGGLDRGDTVDGSLWAAFMAGFTAGINLAASDGDTEGA